MSVAYSNSIDQALKHHQTLCLNLEQCKRRHATHQRFQEKMLPAMTLLHEQFLSHPRRSIYASDHAIERMEQRHIAYRDVVATIECCVPVEARIESQETTHIRSCTEHRPSEWLRYQIALLGEAEDGNLLRVVCALGDDPGPDRSWPLLVLTTYDPSTQPWRWSADGSQRRCFCPREQANELTLVHYAHSGLGLRLG